MKGVLQVTTILLLFLAYTQALIIFVQEIDDTVAVTQIGGLTLTSTVKELKQKIAVIKGLPLTGFQLIYNNALLNDVQPLAAYNVVEGDTITIISKESLLGFLLLGVPPVPPPLLPPLLPPLGAPFPPPLPLPLGPQFPLPLGPQLPLPLAPPLPLPMVPPFPFPLPPPFPFPLAPPLPLPLTSPLAPFLGPPLAPQILPQAAPPLLPPMLPPPVLPPMFPQLAFN